MKRQHRQEKIYLYGKHPLEEALLHAPQAIRKVFLSVEMSRDREVRELLTRHAIPSSVMKGPDAGRMVGNEASHQGVIAIADPMALLTNFDDFLSTLGPKSTHLAPNVMLVLLDELTDPHNVGAIIRSAAAFGAAGVLLPSHNQASITGAVIKASAGMVFRVPIISIGNINYTIDTLKKRGFRTYALSMDGKRNVQKEVFDTPALFIVGNEGRGIRQKTFERADATLQIPMNPRCESLNASVSAALVLHEWSKQHIEALGPSPSRGEVGRGAPPLTPPQEGGGKYER